MVDRQVRPTTCRDEAMGEKTRGSIDTAESTCLICQSHIERSIVLWNGDIDVDCLVSNREADGQHDCKKSIPRHTGVYDT